VLDDPLEPPQRLGLVAPSRRDGLLVHLSETLPLSAAELARKLGLGFAETLARLTALELEGSAARRGEGYIRKLRRE
jgi:predicted Rossmann fold nucleotide-binding protein DprA/Smf involved in DNA uptake